MRSLQFAFKELQQFGFDRFALGISAVAFGYAKVLTERGELALCITDIGLVGRRRDAGLMHVPIQYPVYDQIRIATNRGSEVCIVGLGQAVMTIGLGAVLGLFEAAQDLYLKAMALRVMAKFLQQSAHFVRFAQVATRHPEAAHGFS